MFSPYLCRVSSHYVGECVFSTPFSFACLCYYACMSAFMSFKSIASSTPLGHSVLLSKMSPIGLLVYNMYFSLCYKGKYYKRMRPISYIYICNELNRMYKLSLSKRQVRRATDKLVSLGLLERKTATFVKQYGSQLLPTKTSYYRLALP